jgi:hypothetical protein
MMDEVDKIGMDYRRLSSALLEVLDPEQNPLSGIITRFRSTRSGAVILTANMLIRSSLRLAMDEVIELRLIEEEAGDRQETSHSYNSMKMTDHERSSHRQGHSR